MNPYRGTLGAEWADYLMRERGYTADAVRKEYYSLWLRRGPEYAERLFRRFRNWRTRRAIIRKANCRGLDADGRPVVWIRYANGITSSKVRVR